MGYDHRPFALFLILLVNNVALKSNEDTIPIIEIRAEGKPMTSAQIRALEEEIEGKPLDVKLSRYKKNTDCTHRAKHKDFVTFHYRGFLENGRLFDSTHTTGDPVRVQLQVGQMIEGLDKALDNVCERENLRIEVPWRLAQRRPAHRWKRFPKEEHWIIFDVDVVRVEPWTAELQFTELDADRDGSLTAQDVKKTLERDNKEFGKALVGFNIDLDELAEYFVRYYDADHDGKVTVAEYRNRMENDMQVMMRSKLSKAKRQPRDPGVAWVLDFNDDGVLDYDELSSASQVLHSSVQTEQPKTEL